MIEPSDVLDTEPELTIVNLARFFLSQQSTIADVPIEVVYQLIVLLELEAVKRKGLVH